MARNTATKVQATVQKAAILETTQRKATTTREEINTQVTATRNKNNNVITAWDWVFMHWGCIVWTPIPAYIRNTLGLDKRIGIYSTMLITKHGAECAQAYVSNIGKSPQKV
jgi:hypothetical protein